MRIATFNVNNLFSRYDFTARVDPTDPERVKFRTCKGQLIKGKTPDRALLADRFKALDADVVAVQEVEDITTLTAFAETDLAAQGYPHVVLIEGNDPRFIDVGRLSRVPISAVTSRRHAVDKPTDTDPVFSRSLLQVDILAADRSGQLLTIFNPHLKPRSCDFREDPVTCQQHNRDLRTRRAAVAAWIIAAQVRPDSRYVICGDMNGSPTTPTLAPLTTDGVLELVNDPANAVPDRPEPHDKPPAPDGPSATASYSPDPPPTTNSFTRSGSHLPWPIDRMAPGSAAARTSPATAVTTIPPGPTSPSERRRTPPTATLLWKSPAVRTSAIPSPITTTGDSPAPPVAVARKGAPA
jgi:endonuclease/exonuclease/phosphatase family metal-dependent hydrolase